jgi:hypothetical protein
MESAVRSLLSLVVFLAAVASPLVCAELDLSLLKAASAGDVAAVKKLIAQKADVNYQHGTDKISPLMIAAMRGHKDVLEVLLNSGARPNLTDKDGATALNYLFLVGEDYSEGELRAMAAMIAAKGGTAKEMGNFVDKIIFASPKPVSPKCYDFEKARCVRGAAPVKP